MIISKQLAEFPMDLSLNTKIDPKRLNFRALSVAENIVYETIESFKKRNGYDQIDNISETGSVIDFFIDLKSFKKELLAFSNTTLYSQSPSLNKWFSKGEISSIFPEVKPLTNFGTVSGMVKIGNFEAYSHDTIVEDFYNRTKVSYSILDRSSDSIIVSNREIPHTILTPNPIYNQNSNIAHIGNILYIFYTKNVDISTSHLCYRTVNLLNPKDISQEITIATDMLESFTTGIRAVYDVLPLHNRVYIAYTSTTGLKTFYIKPDQTISPGLNYAENAHRISLSKDYRTGDIFLTYSTKTSLNINPGPVQFVSLDISLQNEVIPKITLDPSGHAFSSIDSLEDEVKIYYVHFDADNGILDEFVTEATIDRQGNLLGKKSFINGLTIQGVPFKHKGENYIPCAIFSTQQPSSFLVDSKGVARVTYFSRFTDVKNPVQANPKLPKSYPNENDDKVYSSGNSLTAGLSVTFDFSHKVKFNDADMGNNKYIAGGIVTMYDGALLVEQGFHMFPERLVATTHSTGGQLSDGTYGYKAVYKWTDAFGNIHRSAPSTNISVTLTGGTSDQAVTISVPILTLTTKERVEIELYRTEVNASEVYYLETTYPNEANTADPYRSYIESQIPDSQLISRQPLYTSGGILENMSLPSAKYLTTYQNRVVALGLEEENAFQYSKETLDGEAVAFADQFKMYVKDEGGPITGGIEFDSKLIIFKETSIYYTTGQGPNNAGLQDDFPEPEQISSDIGCIDARSIVNTPKGVMFKSTKGIYLLQSNLSLIYIGEAVEAFNDYIITNVSVVGETSQVRFLTDNEISLVYNYEQGKWATFTNHAGYASTTILKDYYYLRLDGSIYKENRQSYKDAGLPIKLKITTGWLNLNEIQSFQRAYKMYIIGTYKTPHTLRVKVNYDYVDAYHQEADVKTSDFINESKYGTQSPYGSEVYGDTNFTGNRYQIRFDFKQQKCEAIKVSIEDIQLDEVGEGLTLSGITFQVGAKLGGMKLGSERQAGTK